MIRHCILGLWAALVLVPQTVRAAEPVVETVVDCAGCGKPAGLIKSWCWKHQAKPRDEGYERRKDFCRFAFGPAGPYLYPEKYEPLPLLAYPGIHVPMAPYALPEPAPVMMPSVP